MTIGKKLMLSFALVLAISAVSIVFSNIQLKDLQQTEDSFFEVRLPAMSANYDFRVACNRADAALAHWLLVRDNPTAAQAMKAARAEQMARLEEDLAILQKLAGRFVNPHNRELVAETATALRQYERAQEEIETAASAGISPEVAAQLGAKAYDASDAIRKLNLELSEGIASIVQQQRTSIQDATHTTELVLVAGLVVSLLMGLCIALFSSRKMALALAAVVARADAIAGGDLHGDDLAITSRDEFASLAVAMNGMQSNLRQTIGSIEKSVDGLATASEYIAAAATQATAGAKAQNDEATQVSTAVQEMAATVAEVSSNSGAAAEAARKAAATAKQGGKTVEEALTTMRSIAASVAATAGKVEELGKRSDQIGKIIGVIDEIADQTNLLALNAAIEAARAGDQGRGFAVVADEVRKLAERTTKATREIAQMIESVQQETKTAVENMRAGRQQVEVGVETTTQAGASLAEIITAAQQVGDMVTHIAASATQQASATAQIGTSIGRIASTSSESAAGAQQSASACENLADLALGLHRLVEQFRLEEKDTAKNASPVRGRAPSPGVRSLSPAASLAATIR